MGRKKPVATGDCATCDFWKRKAGPIKGKLIPGGTGKCTRPEGLCENPKPKDPHPGWSGRRKKKGGPLQRPLNSLMAQAIRNHCPVFS